MRIAHLSDLHLRHAVPGELEFPERLGRHMSGRFAAALGDIGRHFPDSSAEFAGIDSRILLRRIVARLQEAAMRVANVDVTVVAQAPKLAPYIDGMRTELAADLQLEPSRVNIKATTTEGMGFAGRGEGIAAYAVALVED